jgi:isoaspartyl peptidase/L-asparaginase-like protein (Ntn-hydrolase superfamily)
VAGLVAREHLLLLQQHDVCILARAREESGRREADDATADHDHPHPFTISAMAGRRTRTDDACGDARPTIVIHAGAGDRTAALRDREQEWHDALRAAIDRGRAALEAGGGALDAAQAAVAFMEDEADQFNAGRGSVLCADGRVEMSAAMMRGSDRAAGGVACVTRTRYPIAAARLVLESERVLMIGEQADAWAIGAGSEQREPSYFVTDEQVALLAEHRAGAGMRDGGPGRDGGTVGAVCLDSHGILAAATSTGGVRGQLPGRVGDTPIFGAGTWADGEVAVSCTGEGEAFIRSGVARQIAARVAAGEELSRAARRALDDVAAVGGVGGLIALDVHGNVATPLLTEVMPRAIWRLGEDLDVQIA